MPRDWKVCGEFALCGACRRSRCRVRTITAAVAEADAGWKEFCAALKTAPEPLLIRERERIELTSATRSPLVRVFLAKRWWSLRLRSCGWSVGRRTDYWQMLSGEILAVEVQLYRETAHGALLANRFASDLRPGEAIACRIVAWLPAPRVKVRPFEFDLSDRHDIASMDLNKLRRAIRLNRVSFPAQLPAFPGAANDIDLQRRAAQLYFVLGWSCAGIAARYNLLPREARRMVSIWKQRAANAGYIQHIPPPTAIGQSAAGADSAAGTDSASEDGLLISALRAGNRAAYDRLLARYQDGVYNLASRLLCDRANAGDVTQAVFLSAFRAVSRPGHISSLRGWLYRFVVTEFLKRRPDEPPARCRESNAPIEQALLEIDPPIRAALVLRELEDLSYEEVAEILQLSVTTVRYRIELGRDLLRRNLIASAASSLPPAIAAAGALTH